MATLEIDNLLSPNYNHREKTGTPDGIPKFKSLDLVKKRKQI